MDRRIALGLVALIGVAAGLLLGLTPVGEGCGSAFAPDYSKAELADQLGPFGGEESTCRDSVGDRRPFAWGALGVGALAGVLALAVPGPSRTRASQGDQQFRDLQ